MRPDVVLSFYCKRHAEHQHVLSRARASEESGFHTFQKDITDQIRHFRSGRWHARFRNIIARGLNNCITAITERRNPPPLNRESGVWVKLGVPKIQKLRHHNTEAKKTPAIRENTMKTQHPETGA